MRVARVLFFEGCPGHRPAVEAVRRIAAELGVPVTVEEVQVRDAAAAARLRFLGSPTVQVDGLDVEPAARGRMEFAFGCRTYDGSPLPPELLIRAALSGNVSLPVTDAPAEPGACCRRATGGQPEGRGVLFAAGAALSGLFSSACCWLPLLLVAAGVSAAGVAGFIHRWRPALAVAAVGLLGASFHAAYFRTGGRCAGGWRGRLRRAAPWIAAVIVGTMLLFPEWMTGLVSRVTGAG